MTTKPFSQQLVVAFLLLLTLSGVVCQQVVFSDDHPQVAIDGSGPSLANLREAVTHALNTCQVRDVLNGTRHRVLSSTFGGDTTVYPNIKHTSDIFQAAVYDYTNGRTILINGIPFDPRAIFFTQTSIQPPVNEEELVEAGRIAGARPDEIVHVGMPPFERRVFPDGNSHRVLNIALISPNSSRTARVNLNNGTHETPPPLRVPSNAPTCGAPQPAVGTSVHRGTPGTANLIISQNGATLWTLEAIRPSLSSGTRGSGIELRNVKYKGKSLLSRAHVPILNVQYDNPISGCGPTYRDWQYEEWPFQCSGGDIAPGFRLCSSPAKAILDAPHTDGGNFGGVAVYVDGQEVVLKSQMKAGWYRYVSEWRFHVDGTLKPRFGFGAVSQSPFCVCQVHRHNVYWRLDFDIVTPGNNLVREFNKPPIFPNTNYHDKIHEIRRPKDASHQRHWEISNTRTGSTYSLIPGANDGAADRYGVGDLWVLKYHGDEIDDRVDITSGTAAQTMAQINKFVNGELVRDTDVVVWYGAHFKHDQSHEGGGDHVVGPEIRPVKW